jgi:fumarate reductase iron-sulfur subunit
MLDEPGGMSAVTLRVFRWAPGEPERTQEYRVGVGASTTVLDCLVNTQRQQDPSLAFRYACRVGMCGSCAMIINGRERWACRTLAGVLGATISVRPLYHFPLIRDLVVDMAPFVEKMRGVGAAMVTSPAEPEHAPTAVPECARRANPESTQGPAGPASARPPAPDHPRPAEREDASPAAPEYVGRAGPGCAVLPGDSPERRDIDPAIECIGCGMCVSACTVVAHNRRFPGPAALNRAFTLQRDHRDRGQEARWAVLLSEDALTRCHGQGNCTEVCPMGLAPSASIIRLRRRAALRLLGLAS